MLIKWYFCWSSAYTTINNDIFCPSISLCICSMVEAAKRVRDCWWRFLGRFHHGVAAETFCLPILSYSCEARCYNKQQQSQLNTCWNRAYRKIFEMNDWESVEEVQGLCGRLDFNHIYTPCPRKKRPQYYSRHNFDNFSHSFVIFGLNHPDISLISAY